MFLFGITPFLAVSAFAAPPTLEKSPASVAKPPVATRVYEKPAVLRKEDPALEKRVTVDKPFVYMGELLELLSEQSGVVISASDTDGAAGEELTAVLDDMPLADVMDSLVSLLSRRGVRWQWRREGGGNKKSPYTYRLLRPDGYVSAYAESVKKQVQVEFEKESDEMIAGLDMSPEELKQRAKEYPALDYLMRGRETPYGIRAFRDCLTPAQRLQVLRNHDDKGIKLPLSELAPAGKILEKYMHDLHDRLNPGTVISADTASFWVPKTDGSDMPTLVIGFGELGGWTYIGGKTLKDKILTDEEKEWTHNDETRTIAELEERQLATPKKIDPNMNYAGWSATPRRFGLLGREGGFSVLARSQRYDQRDWHAEPWEMPLKEYLADYRKTRSVIHKWRKTSDNKPVLLLDFSGWYMSDTDPETPRQTWGAVKRLREVRTKNTNESVFAFAIIASTNLTERQQNQLERTEFPLIQWGRMRNYWFGDFAKWVAASPRNYERLLSAEGVRVAEAGFRDTPALKTGQPELEMSDRVRVVVSPDTEKAVACRIEFLSRDGRVIASHPLPTWEAGYKMD